VLVLDLRDGAQVVIEHRGERLTIGVGSRGTLDFFGGPTWVVDGRPVRGGWSRAAFPASDVLIIKHFNPAIHASDTVAAVTPARRKGRDRYCFEMPKSWRITRLGGRDWTPDKRKSA